MWDEPTDSGDSGVWGFICGGEVTGKKVGKEYYTPGILLEFGSSDEDDEEFAPPSNEGRRKC